MTHRGPFQPLLFCDSVGASGAPPRGAGLHPAFPGTRPARALAGVGLTERVLSRPCREAGLEGTSRDSCREPFRASDRVKRKGGVNQAHVCTPTSTNGTSRAAGVTDVNAQTPGATGRQGAGDARLARTRSRTPRKRSVNTRAGRQGEGKPPQPKAQTILRVPKAGQRAPASAAAARAAPGLRKVTCSHRETAGPSAPAWQGGRGQNGAQPSVLENKLSAHVLLCS